MKTYKLLKRYPSLSLTWEKGMLVSQGKDRGIYASFLSCDSKYNDIQIPYQDVVDYPEFWEKVIQKDYEILSFIHDGGHRVPIGYIVNMKDGILDDLNQKLEESHYLNSHYWKINSVKRLSDGEIFKLEDKLDGFDITARISLFRVEDNQMRVGFKEVGVISLNACKHKKEPIAISEDGVELFEGDNFYALNVKTLEVLKINNNETYIISSYCNQENAKKAGILWFSSEKARSEYIDNNKPRYTFKDVVKILKTFDEQVNEYTGEDYEKFLREFKK